MGMVTKTITIDSGLRVRDWNKIRGRKRTVFCTLLSQLKARSVCFFLVRVQKTMPCNSGAVASSFGTLDVEYLHSELWILLLGLPWICC